MDFLPAIAYGLEDSINPYYLITFLVFTVCLSVWGKSLVSIVSIGLSYVFAVILTVFIIHVGVADSFFASKIVEMALRSLSLFFALLFLGTGIVHLLDWMKYKKSSDVKVFRIPLPCFLDGSVSVKERSFKDTKSEDADEPLIKSDWQQGLGVFKVVAVASILGFISAVPSAVWPADYFVLVSFFFGFYSGQTFLSILFFLSYALFVVMPIVIFWGISIGLVFSKDLRISVLNSISMWKIVYSAAYIATAAALIYAYVQRMFL